VETKNSTVGEGAKVPHLTYVGDAEIGPGVNVGAGTIFANYDGVAKHRTEIGANAFIGSNTVLVAPRKVGDGAYTAAGSTVVQDVPAGAIGVARGRQRNVEGWTERKRAGTRSAEAARSAREAESEQTGG
jgi:bifunctional UDP-N-acetylglucosamine pyrophosphorylase/glucosamine-1-phosphate N-acetyltransferase